MRTDRRGFLAALVLAPLGVKLAPQLGQCWAIDIEAPSYPLLTSNLWKVGPPLTEARMIEVMEAWQRSPYFKSRLHDSFVFEVPRLQMDHAVQDLSAAWDETALWK